MDPVSLHIALHMKPTEAVEDIVRRATDIVLLQAQIECKEIPPELLAEYQDKVRESAANIVMWSWLKEYGIERNELWKDPGANIVSRQAPSAGGNAGVL